MKSNKHVRYITNFEGFYWSYKFKRWGKSEELNDDTIYSYFTKVKTLRAAKRHVRNCSKYLPPRIEFIVVYKYADIEPVSLWTK